jgi:ATP-dependent DNA helicase RecG
MTTSVAVGKGQGPLVQYLAGADPDALAEALVAFANADGGTILVGVDEHGRPNGEMYEDELESALRVAERGVRPPVQVGWERIESEAGTCIAINVPRSPLLHALADGRVLIRTGLDNRPLSGDEIRQLSATKSTADFEGESVAGATRADLDDEIIAEYIAKREERQRRKVEVPVDVLLQQIGALDGQGHPTHTGILLFAPDPQVYLPHSGLIFVKFVGTEPRGEDGLAGYGRREEVGGPLARVIENAWQIIWEEMVVGAVVKGLAREERTEYPPFAVRESLVNAVCHRDYRLRGRRIEIRMFTDRLEVISPGGLPGFITVDNLVEEHFSRNPRLVAGLFQWGYIEELGLGIDRMIEDMVQAGHSPPKFRATPYSFTVVLSNARERRAVPQWTSHMNERQARAAEYVREHGSITNREYRTLCPDVSPETLRLDLVDLVEKSVFLKIGSKKGTYYILK